MTSFDENGKYIKTNWKAGDKITATKLNKIEESIEAVNDNDISRHVEADARLDALEAKDVAHDKEFTNVRNLIADNKAAAELGDYEINSRMTFLENELNEGIEEVHNVANTVDGKIATAEANMTAQVNQGKADMEAMVAEVESEMNELRNDIQRPMNLAGEVKNAYKFTVDNDGMMPSLVTLDNIEGLSSIELNVNEKSQLVTTYLKNVCTIDTSKNYFEDSVFSESIFDATYTQNGNTITVTSNRATSSVKFKIPTLVEGKKYCILCDNIIDDEGSSAIEYPKSCEYNTINQCYNMFDVYKSAFNAILVYNDDFYIGFHNAVGIPGGTITYENIQIYEVKEMIIPDIRLNSLPNGVKDEIKDGMLIKRTGIVNLADLKWSCNSNQSTFAMYYSGDVPNLKMSSSFDAIDNNILCNCFENSSTSVLDDPNNYSENIINSHWSNPELKIKISKNDFPDGDLYAWLRNNGAQAVYELAIPEYIPVNLNIKVDKGDTVVINTTKTMDLTYDIQLNTRAQIDTLQTNMCMYTSALAGALKEAINKIEQLEARMQELENK